MRKIYVSESRQRAETKQPGGSQPTLSPGLPEKLNILIVDNILKKILRKAGAKTITS